MESVGLGQRDAQLAQTQSHPTLDGTRRQLQRLGYLDVG
jgi:hypothetical protein